MKYQKVASRVCSLPFTQLFIQSSGKVFPCSFLQNSLEVGNILNADLSDIWKGRAMTSFRKDHLEGIQEQCCSNQEKFSCDKYIRRFEITENLSEHPLRLDIMIDSYCNLACIMCTNILEARGGFEKESFWEHCSKEIFPHIEEVEVIGGEPFLCSDSYRLFKVITEVNPDCRWVLTTNGNYKLNSKIKDSLDPLNIGVFAYSIDTLNKATFDKIRIGGNFNLVMTTFEDYCDYFNIGVSKKENFSFDVNTVVQVHNAYEIPEIVAFARNKNCGLHLILLLHPFEFSVLNQAEPELEKILDFYFSSLRKSFDPEFYRLTLALLKKSPVKIKVKFTEDVLFLKKLIK